ncbi:scavenger receptor cysteine-rich type 1 protein M160-like [Sylvia borin]
MTTELPTIANHSFWPDNAFVTTAPAAVHNGVSMVCSGGCPKKGQTCWCPKQPRQPGPSMPTGSRRVRLVGSSGPCAGRVEVYSGGSWSSVCQEGWDVQDAAVVCRELGCGRALEAPRSARFGPGTGPPWPYIPECSGSEESLWECGRSEGRECRLGGGAAAVCSEHVSVRLAGGGGRCRGFLEVYHNGTWGRVCASGTSHGTGAAVCRQLGCGEPARLSAVPARQPSRAWLAWVGCEDGARSLWGCPSAPWQLQSCGPGGDVHVACEEDSGGITETDTGTPYPEGASSTGSSACSCIPHASLAEMACPHCLNVSPKFFPAEPRWQWLWGLCLCQLSCVWCWGRCCACPWVPWLCCCAVPGAKALAELQMPSPMLSTRSWTILRCTSTRRCPVAQVPCQRDRSRSCPITPGTAWRGVTPRQSQGTPDGYDDVLDVPQEAPAASTGDISEGVSRHRWICVLPTGGICSPPRPPGADSDPSVEPSANTDYDDVGSSTLGTLP